MSKQLMAYFSKPRLGILSTADKNGKVDSGYFGSPRMIAEKTLLLGLDKSRTFANPRENPRACFLIMEPESKLPEWKGARVYLEMIDCQTSGDNGTSVFYTVDDRHEWYAIAIRMGIFDWQVGSSYRSILCERNWCKLHRANPDRISPYGIYSLMQIFEACMPGKAFAAVGKSIHATVTRQDTPTTTKPSAHSQNVIKLRL